MNDHVYCTCTCTCILCMIICTCTCICLQYMYSVHVQCTLLLCSSTCTCTHVYNNYCINVIHVHVGSFKVRYRLSTKSKRRNDDIRKDRTQQCLLLNNTTNRSPNTNTDIPTSTATTTCATSTIGNDCIPTTTSDDEYMITTSTSSNDSLSSVDQSLVNIQHIACDPIITDSPFEHTGQGPPYSLDTSIHDIPLNDDSTSPHGYSTTTIHSDIDNKNDIDCYSPSLLNTATVCDSSPLLVPMVGLSAGYNGQLKQNCRKRKTGRIKQSTITQTFKKSS